MFNKSKVFASNFAQVSCNLSATEYRSYQLYLQIDLVIPWVKYQVPTKNGMDLENLNN